MIIDLPPYCRQLVNVHVSPAQVGPFGSLRKHMYEYQTHHTQCDGAGSGSRLAFKKQLGRGHAHNNVNQDDLENVHFEFVLGVEEGHVCDLESALGLGLTCAGKRSM